MLGGQQLPNLQHQSCLVIHANHRTYMLEDYHQHADHSITRVCRLHDRGRFWLDAIRCTSIGDISKFEALYETLWWKKSRTQHLSLRRQCMPIRAQYGSYILPQVILGTSLTASWMNTPYTFLYLSWIKIIYTLKIISSIAYRPSCCVDSIFHSDQCSSQSLLLPLFLLFCSEK